LQMNAKLANTGAQAAGFAAYITAHRESILR